MLATVLIALFLAGLIFGALHDVASMTIPNWLSIAFAVLFPVGSLMLGVPLVTIGWHILAGFIALLICFGQSSG